MRKPGFETPGRPDFDSTIGSEVSWKQARKKPEFVPSLGAKTTFETGSQNHSKINQILILDPHVCILLLPYGSPRVLPRCQSGPPRVPKLRHQAPQMATAGSYKGKDAEGVALKIQTLSLPNLARSSNTNQRASTHCSREI